MGKGRYLLGQHCAIFAHAAGANLHQVIETAGDHVDLLDLAHPRHRRVEGRQRLFPRIAEPHLDKGDMVESQPDRVDQRAVAADDPLGLQPPEPGLGGGFRQPDAAGEIGNADPALAGQNAQNHPVEPVESGPVVLHRIASTFQSIALTMDQNPAIVPAFSRYTG